MRFGGGASWRQTDIAWDRAQTAAEKTLERAKANEQDKIDELEKEIRGIEFKKKVKHALRDGKKVIEREGKLEIIEEVSLDPSKQVILKSVLEKRHQRSGPEQPKSADRATESPSESGLGESEE
jgi:hypothetical protein